MTPTKTSDRTSAFGAVKRMSTDSDDLDWSTPQENTSEVGDGVNLLSSLLLSLILKLEDREYRVKEDPSARQRTQSADESSDRSRQKHFDDYDNAGALVSSEDFTQRDYSTDSNTEDAEKIDDYHDTITESRSERSHFPNDPTHPNYNRLTQRDSDTRNSTSGLSCVRSDVPEDMLPPTSNTFKDAVTQTSLCKQDQGSAYRDSAVHIVGDALLRAIANIFTNGVIRRGVRTYGITVWKLTDYRSTQASISHENIDRPLICRRQIKPKLDLVSPEWLYDVNRRIAAPDVTTVGDPDSMPPSVASSCNVSRCSSVDILSCGDRALKVKAIPPSQSKLLWKMVQKSHGSNNVKKPVDEPDLIPVYVPENDGLAKEERLELSKALERVKESTPRKRYWGEKSTDGETIEDSICLKIGRPVKFRDSAAQTEKKDFKKDDKSIRDDDVIDTKQMIREAQSPPHAVQPDERVMTEVSTAQTNQEPTPQVKQLNVPPIASPLLMDVVWRNASNNDMTNQEERHFKAHFARGGVRVREKAKVVVECALHRAVSEVLVERVISDSLESLTSLSKLRITPSFKKAAADLTNGPPLQFEWFPYLEGSAGPCKVTDRRRQRVDRIGEAKTRPQVTGSSESTDVYEDAREKFGSSDDLLTEFFKGQVNSSDDEYTDAVCESECVECQVSAKKPTTTDKATQVSHTVCRKDSSGSPSDDIEDEPIKSPEVQLELPTESINYIKDQFKDVKVLVAKYRELLYEPLDESVPVESQGQPRTNQNEGQTSDFREVNTWQNRPGFDETDEDNDNVVTRKPKRKHTKVEKEMKKVEKLTKDDTQTDDEETTDAKLKGRTDKGKKENKSFQAEREADFANQEVVNKDEENDAPTHKQQVGDRPPKVKDKRKKRYDSPTRDKTSVRRTLKKTGDKMRTPIGRQRKTVLEKTTRDGFLPLNVKAEPDKSIESKTKTGTTELLEGGAKSSRKTKERVTTSSKPTDEDKPEVKNRISFFEKFSKHSLKRSDQTRPSSNSPSTEPDTPVKRAAHNAEKLERLPNSESMKQKVTHQSDEMRRKGKDSGKRDKLVNPESCIDSTPGKGIWTNRAFFEALGEPDDQTVPTSTPPKTAKRILEDGLLDELGNEEDGQQRPSLKTKREASRRERSSTTSPTKTDGKSKSPSSQRKKKTRNKNTNNEALLDQVTTDDSCISSSQCSCTDTTVEANGKIAVDRLHSSEIKNCDDATNAKNTETSGHSGSNEVERTVQTRENIPKLSSESLNFDNSQTTDHRRVSSSPCSDSKIENEDDAVLLDNNTPHQQLSFERVNSDEATTTETKCVTSSPGSVTSIEKEEEAFVSHIVTPHQQLSSESLNNGKARVSKSPSRQMETENGEYALKSNDIVFDHNPYSEVLPHTNGPSGGHSHFQMDDDRDEINTVNMKESIFEKSQSTESVTEYEPQTKEIKKNYDITTDLDDDSVVLQSHNHHTDIGQVISEELTEEDTKVTSVDDLLADLSLNDDLSQEVQIHSPPPTGELDDVSSLNNLDVPLLTSSPHPHRRLKKSTLSLESIEKGRVQDQTPPILQNGREDDDNLNDGDEESGDDLLHHLRNTSFLLACNPDCYMSKDQPAEDAQINENVDDRKKQSEQKKTSDRPMENPQSQSEINSIENPQSQSEINSMENPQSQSEIKSLEDPQSQSEIESLEDPQSQSEIESLEDPQSQSKINSMENPKSQSEKKPMENPQSQSEIKPMENPQSQSEIKPMENPQSQSEIKQDGVNIVIVSAQATSELPSNVCQALTSDGEQEARSKVKSSMRTERRKCGEQKSCLRFSLFRKSKKRSRSKNISLGQSKGNQQPSSDVDCVPQDETHTASKVEEKDAGAMVTKECTNEEVDTSTDSNPTPPGSQKRKFRLKYLRKSKKHKVASKT